MQSEGEDDPVDGGVGAANDEKFGQLLEGLSVFLEMQKTTAPSHQTINNIPVRLRA